MSLPRGGVRTHTVVDCTRCGSPIFIPPGMILRIPGKHPKNHCHEVVDPSTGVVHKRG